MATRDERWWKLFKAAPPELRRAMNDTATARDTVEQLERKGATAEQLRPFRRRLVNLEHHELGLRLAFEHPYSGHSVPLSREQPPVNPPPGEPAAHAD